MLEFVLLYWEYKRKRIPDLGQARAAACSPARALMIYAPSLHRIYMEIITVFKNAPLNIKITPLEKLFHLSMTLFSIVHFLWHFMNSVLDSVFSFFFFP